MENLRLHGLPFGGRLVPMSALPQHFIRKIVRCLEEEEVDVYTLTLYSMNANDMSYFNEKDREHVKRIFKVLMEDTKRHAELLKLIVEMSES